MVTNLAIVCERHLAGCRNLAIAPSAQRGHLSHLLISSGTWWRTTHWDYLSPCHQIVKLTFREGHPQCKLLQLGKLRQINVWRGGHKRGITHHVHSLWWIPVFPACDFSDRLLASPGAWHWRTKEWQRVNQHSHQLSSGVFSGPRPWKKKVAYWAQNIDKTNKQNGVRSSSQMI